MLDNSTDYIILLNLWIILDLCTLLWKDYWSSMNNVPFDVRMEGQWAEMDFTVTGIIEGKFCHCENKKWKHK